MSSFSDMLSTTFWPLWMSIFIKLKVLIINSENVWSILHCKWEKAFVYPKIPSGLENRTLAHSNSFKKSKSQETNYLLFLLDLIVTLNLLKYQFHDYGYRKWNIVTFFYANNEKHLINQTMNFFIQFDCLTRILRTITIV